MPPARVIVALRATYVAAQDAAQVTRTELLRKSVCVFDGNEFVVFVADLQPGAVAGRHSHPSDQAIDMLEATHSSTSEPAKVLDCMLAEKVRPLATAVP